MHDGMPYDPIQGQHQGHERLKATQEESTVCHTVGRGLQCVTVVQHGPTWNVEKLSSSTVQHFCDITAAFSRSA